MNERRNEILARMKQTPPSSKAQASVETFVDHEVITPRVTLREKAAVYTDRASLMDSLAIQRAETALDEVSGNFFSWMDEEVGRLMTSFAALESAGVGEDRLERFFSAAHNIKGCATTYGFPIASHMANGLVQIIIYCDRDMPPLDLMRNHCDSIRAIVREDVRGLPDGTALELAQQLDRLSASYLRSLPPVASDTPVKAET